MLSTRVMLKGTCLVLVALEAAQAQSAARLSVAEAQPVAIIRTTGTAFPAFAAPIQMFESALVVTPLCRTSRCWWSTIRRPPAIPQVATCNATPMRATGLAGERLRFRSDQLTR